MLLSVAAKTDSYLQFMTVLILFLLVLGVTYLVTRWIAKYQKGRTVTGNLEVIETCRIAPNKYVQILRAGTKYLVIAVGKDEVHMLSELSKDQVSLIPDDAGAQTDFAAILERIKHLKEKEKD